MPKVLPSQLVEEIDSLFGVNRNELDWLGACEESAGTAWFVADSPLEGSGFEPSVPLPRLSSIRAVRAENIGRSTDVFRRDREFDVSALQGRLSTSSQSRCSTAPGLIAGTWH